MAIDIRASITCSLGDIVSGGVSDDYFGEQGLIKTRGRVDVVGVTTPAIGSTLTFSYDAFGTTRRIPRKLYVLSSFADPFRRTTQVELGCKLTYLQDRRPAPTVQGADVEPSSLTGRTIQCLNNYTPPAGSTFGYPANSQVGFPIRAADVMDTCLDRLGITASKNPLTNVFYIEKFDLTPGYVQVLSDLLISEGYCGYLDENDILQVFSLSNGGSGAAPVVNQEQVIDITSGGFGELPADAIVVRYNSVKLSGNAALDPAGTPADQATTQSTRNWSVDEEEGDQTTFYVRGQFGSRSFVHTPYTKTVTTYGTDQSFSDTACVLSGVDGPDLSDAAIRRVTTTSVIAADVANSYVSQLLDLGVSTAGALTGVTTTIATYQYDNKGNQVEEVVEVYEPFFMWAGRLNMTWVYGGNYIQLGSEDVLVSRQITKTTTLYARLPVFVSAGADEIVEPVVNGQKVVRTLYQNWATTQQGNQGVANNREVSDFNSASEALAYLISVSGILVHADTSISSSDGRIISGYSKRPKYGTQLNSTADANATSGPDTVQTEELIYVTGSATSSRIVELSMPYQSDDYYTADGVLVKGDAEAKAANYGRIQNKLRHGQRYGLNIQTAANMLPPKPFQPFALNAAGFAGLYLTNGLSWTFDGNGILTSCDALLWGGLGSTTGTSAPAANAFFPVAPGVTTVPTAPAIVNTAPNQVLGTIPAVGSTPQTALSTAYPNAVAGDGVQVVATDDVWVYNGTTWGNVGTNPGPTMQVAAPLPIWQEIRPMLASVRTVLSVTSFSYALELLTEVAPLTVRSKLVAASILKVEVPVSGITVAAVAPAVSIGAAVRPAETAIAIGAEVPSVAAGASVKPPAIDVALAALAPDVRTGTSVAAPAVDISVAAVAPVSVGAPPVLIYVPTTDIALAVLAPVVVTGASVAMPAKDIAVAAVVPTVLSADPNFSSVSLLLHMDGTNASTTFTDSSSNALTVTANGNAQISTAQSKFGGASALFDGSGDSVRISSPPSALINWWTGNFTIEYWIRATSFTQAGGGNASVVAGNMSATTTSNYWSFGPISNGTVRFYYFNGSVQSITTTTALSTNTWHHLAFVKNGTGLTIYINGVSSVTGTVAGTPQSSTTTDFCIGQYNNTSFNGYLDELRVTTAARYTSAFTPTTVAFPNA